MCIVVGMYVYLYVLYVYTHKHLSLSLRLYVSVQLCACMCMDASMRACVQREDLPRYNRHASEFAADIAEAWCDLILCYHIKIQYIAVEQYCSVYGFSYPTLRASIVFRKEKLMALWLHCIYPGAWCIAQDMEALKGKESTREVPLALSLPLSLSVSPPHSLSGSLSLSLQSLNPISPHPADRSPAS